MIPSELVFSPSLPKVDALGDVEKIVLIYDQKLLTMAPGFKAWSHQFPRRYGVRSGEKLKALNSFPRHFNKLAELSSGVSPREMNVVAVGGGSIGDFAGFFASVFKRGVRLTLIPSTWLSAIDSSHGGKTALNATGAKNQLGTFYPAHRIFLVRALLKHQPKARIAEASGEFAKIALIDGGPWVGAVESSNLNGENLLWFFLRPAIAAKLKIVKLDPEEKNGLRQLLNFGHTIGHVVEAAHGWKHGRAVTCGLFFALELSCKRGLLAGADASRSFALLTQLGLKRERVPLISEKKFRALLGQDKKLTSDRAVQFVMLTRIGRPERHTFTLTHLVAEARRQRIVK